MNQIKQQPTPYKVDRQKPKTEYFVEPNGDVKIIQTTTITSYWKHREFVSLFRGNEKALENTRNNYSEEFIQKMKDQEKEIQQELDIMKPVLQKSEELTKKEYEKNQVKGLKNALIEALSHPKENKAWLEQIWFGQKEELRNKVLKQLDKDTESKYLKAISKIKRQK